MIDEKKLIEEMWNNFNSYYNDANRFTEEETKMADRVLGGVQCMIESQPKIVTDTNVGSKWIPCKRELPKTNGVYQITRELKVGEDIYRISDSAYFDGQDTWHNDNRYNHVRLPLTDIVAWKPLDEPYEEEVNQ